MIQKRSILRVFLIAMILSFTVACSEKEKDQEIQVTLEMSVDGNPLSDKHVVTGNKGMTALTALQNVAEVKTRPVSSYVIVSQVDTFKNIRGDMAWYYEVNGESANILSINNKLQDGDHVEWIYKEDVCSPKVDGELSEL